MTTTHGTNVEELWIDLIDRDLEILITGGTPVNNDLVPLRSFVSTLSSFRDVEPSEGFVETQAGLSAASARAIHESAEQTPVKPRETLMFGIRRRATALATSLLMVSGMTGMALAADGAAPGDWYFGIDQALEVIGVGAGGAQERLQELQVLKSDDSTEPQVEDRVVSGGPTNITGPERAIQAVTDHGSDQSATVRADVAMLIAARAANHGKPAVPGKPDNTPGKPENTPGKPENTPGKP